MTLRLRIAPVLAQPAKFLVHILKTEGVPVSTPVPTEPRS